MKPVTLYMHKSGEKLQWFPHQRVLYDTFVKTISDCDSVEVKFKKQSRTKTTKQLGYYHSVILLHAKSAMIDAGYNTLEMSFGENTVEVETTTERVDELLKAYYQAYKGIKEKPLKRNMSVEDMSDYIDFCLGWLAKELGLYCPAPGEF